MRQLSPSRETTHRYMRETNKTQENKNWTGKNLMKKGEEKKKREEKHNLYQQQQQQRKKHTSTKFRYCNKYNTKCKLYLKNVSKK